MFMKGKKLKIPLFTMKNVMYSEDEPLNRKENWLTCE